MKEAQSIYSFKKRASSRNHSSERGANTGGRTETFGHSHGKRFFRPLCKHLTHTRKRFDTKEPAIALDPSVSGIALFAHISRRNVVSNEISTIVPKRFSGSRDIGKKSFSISLNRQPDTSGVIKETHGLTDGSEEENVEKDPEGPCKYDILPEFELHFFSTRSFHRREASLCAVVGLFIF
jgi:hypothetical protein